MIILASRRALVLSVAVLSMIGGTLVALHYHRLDLTLSHYDARGHLVVARRIIDSLTPGWQQIGAVWLPLPHLLNMLPVQIDALYRTGASAVSISVMAFAVATAAIAWIVHSLTDSAPAAVAGAAVFAFNPNVLYLQATPMTEPLLLALTIVAVALLIEWCDEEARLAGRTGRAGLKSCATTAAGTSATGTPATSTTATGTTPTGRTATLAGWAFALACLTRYEAWPVTFCALSAAIWTLWRRGDSVAVAARRVARIAVYPALAIAAFFVFSRVVIGEWFVSSGFFVPDNTALNDPVEGLAEIWWGTHMLSGYAMVALGTVGVLALVVTALVSRPQASALVALSLVATAAVPWAAFVKGHPFRIRYMVPLIAMEAVGAGVAAGLVRRARPLAALALLALVAYELRPLDRTAQMVVEAQWDRPNVPARQQVTKCLAGPLRGAKIMASMGSLGHYMQETSTAGLNLRDFLHEGNGDIWLAALATGPRPFAEWVLIEEKAEGGDMLAERAREQPHFLDGYSRVCEGAGLALYRRDENQNLTLIMNK